MGALYLLLEMELTYTIRVACQVMKVLKEHDEKKLKEHVEKELKECDEKEQ